MHLDDDACREHANKAADIRWNMRSSIPSKCAHKVVLSAFMQQLVVLMRSEQEGSTAGSRS